MITVDNFQRVINGMFQYRQRYQEGYNTKRSILRPVCGQVSIPTTVSGGLQLQKS